MKCCGLADRPAAASPDFLAGKNIQTGDLFVYKPAQHITKQVRRFKQERSKTFLTITKKHFPDALYVAGRSPLIIGASGVNTIALARRVKIPRSVTHDKESSALSRPSFFFSFASLAPYFFLVAT